MTIDQLNSLTEDELAMCLVIVNVIAPPCIPKMEFGPKDLLWFKHDMLIQKIFDSFSRLTPEGHSLYKSLLSKLGVTVEINKIEPPPTPASLPATASTEVTASNL